MPHQMGLPDALARFGLTVELVPGWEKRGSSSFTPQGSITHHTAGPLSGDRPSLGICVNGRSDLPGPLCNVFLPRSGVAVVVAAGRANHGGAGAWKGLSGNSLFFGTEAESAGQGDWTESQRRAYPRVHAAFHSLPGMRGPDYCCAHREYATPPGRKPDPTGIDMPTFRAQVAALLADPTGGDDDLDKAEHDLLVRIGNDIELMRPIVYHQLDPKGGQQVNLTLLNEVGELQVAVAELTRKVDALAKPEAPPPFKG